MTEEEIEICNYLKERWGNNFIKARMKGNVIHIDVSQSLFFAWDDYKHWDCDWGSANSNLDPIFEKKSKWADKKFSFGHGPTMVGGWEDIDKSNQAIDNDALREKVFNLLEHNMKTSPEELGLSDKDVLFLGSKGIHWDEDTWIDLDKLIEMN